MATIYAVCAVIGGTILVCQFAMTLFGLGHETLDVDLPADVDMPDDVGDFGEDGGGETHHNSSWFFGVITFRTLVAAVTFFGLAGLAGESSELIATQTFIIALVSGLAAMYGVHSVMRGLTKLQSDGTVQIRNAVGKPGTVYLKVPGNKSGMGRVQVNVSERTMEYEAMTLHDDLPTGTPIVVVNIIGPDTVEVAPADSAKEYTDA